MFGQRRLRLLGMALFCGALSCTAQQQNAPTSQLPRAATLAGPGFEPGGLGSLEVRGNNGDTSLLRLSRVQIAAVQRGDMAEVEATHTFDNDSDDTLEGTFRFPMPDGALVTGLAMMIDGKLMEGELVEREKAKKAYEAVVDGMQDPALLEWEHGSLFKMRVFPLEPHKQKVVTMRYLTPLRRSADKLELVQAAAGGAGSGSVSQLVIDWQGKRVFDEKNVAASRVLAFPAKPVSAVLRERRADGVYSVVRLNPDWSHIPQAAAPPPKNWFIVVDTSRSALEELPRELEALGVVLASLPAGARFRVVTSDLAAAASPQGLVPPTPASIAAATEFVKQVTPDGASDLGRAVQLVSELAQTTTDNALLYLGDCEPTWGVTEPKELLALAQRALPHTPIYPIMFGASVNDDLAGALAEQSGGRQSHIRRREDLDAFAGTLATGVPTLTGIEVKAASGNEVLPAGPLALEKGRELLLLVKAPVGGDPLAGLSVKAKVNGAALDLLPHATPEDAGGVGRRYGAALVRQLEKTGRPAPDIVNASLSYGVMSKLTSFLVLESEEAYARFSIERKQAQARAADAPRVTGANLENADGADISADRIQPGDPEIFVDAERSALSVKVEFPFGETKTANYDVDADAGRGAWMVRFLVARDTPEGDYEARALIQHADGSLETRKVRYTVDHTAPELAVELRPQAHHPDLLEVWVTQPDAGALADLKRVEIRTPAGTIYQLVAVRWGVFRGFVPRRELRGGTLRVVGFDLALNHGVKEVELP